MPNLRCGSQIFTLNVQKKWTISEKTAHLADFPKEFPNLLICKNLISVKFTKLNKNLTEIGGS